MNEYGVEITHAGYIVTEYNSGNVRAYEYVVVNADNESEAELKARSKSLGVCSETVESCSFTFSDLDPIVRNDSSMYFNTKKL